MLHEERKLKERAGTGVSSEKAMSAKKRSVSKGPKCHHCGKIVHFKRNCWELTGKKPEASQKEQGNSKHRAHKAVVKRRDSDSYSSECVGLIVSYPCIVRFD